MHRPQLFAVLVQEGVRAPFQPCAGRRESSQAPQPALSHHGPRTSLSPCPAAALQLLAPLEDYSKLSLMANRSNCY